jgi:hypothetical protein
MATFPLRGARDAPTFDNNPLHLSRYFEDIDLLYGVANVLAGDDVKIRKTKYYLDHDTAALWESIPVPGGMTWAQFKAAIFALYPGSDDNNRYTLTDLERLAHEHATQGIFTRGELGEYYRKWVTISAWLTARRLGDQRGLNRIFI